MTHGTHVSSQSARIGAVIDQVTYGGPIVT